MSIILQTDAEIPFPDPRWINPQGFAHFRERARISFNTIKQIIETGGIVEVTPADQQTARSYAQGHIPAATLEISEENAGMLLYLEALLSKYDIELVDRAKRTRNYVVNKLLMESEKAQKTSDRLKALEMLGRLSDVGAFTERTEVQVTHRTVKQIDADLEEVLERYLGPAEEVQVTPTLPISVSNAC